jgi:hypothetical protein
MNFNNGTDMFPEEQKLNAKINSEIFMKNHSEL